MHENAKRGSKLHGTSMRIVGLIASLGVFGDQLGLVWSQLDHYSCTAGWLGAGKSASGTDYRRKSGIILYGACQYWGICSTGYDCRRCSGHCICNFHGEGYRNGGYAGDADCSTISDNVMLKFRDSAFLRLCGRENTAATHWLIGMITIVRRFLLVFFAFYLGSEAVGSMINAIPAYVTDGMAAAAGLLPALGFAMLMRMTVNRQNVPYYFLGFALAAYMSVPVLGVAILGVILIVVKFDFMNLKGAAAGEAGVEVNDDDF